MSFLLCKLKSIPQIIVKSTKQFHLFNNNSLLNIQRTINKQPGINILLQPNRKLYLWIFRRIPKRKLKQIDKIPNEYELIYRNDLDRYLLGAQLMIFFTSIFFGILILTHGRTVQYEELSMALNKDQGEDMNIETEEQKFLLMFTVYVLVNTVMYYFLSRTPVRIYTHPSKQHYILCEYKFLPGSIKKIGVKAGEIEYIEPSIMDYHLYRSKGGDNFYMLERYFRKMSDLYDMIGNDNPFEDNE